MPSHERQLRDRGLRDLAEADVHGADRQSGEGAGRQECHGARDRGEPHEDARAAFTSRATSASRYATGLSGR